MPTNPGEGPRPTSPALGDQDRPSTGRSPGARPPGQGGAQGGEHQRCSPGDHRVQFMVGSEATEAATSTQPGAAHGVPGAGRRGLSLGWAEGSWAEGSWAETMAGDAKATGALPSG